MRNLVFALLLLPTVSFAQFENNPVQQRLWNGMTNAAPAYEMLLACERDVTAGLVLESMQEFIALSVNTQNDVRIAIEMWNRARTNAQLEYSATIRGLRQSPQGQLCNNLENDVIQNLNKGI